ncbi:PilZ domain-containing protein [Pseudoalteromonas ruthenica]|uniref:PilZ domain-containing protein n=1 Tax=Pseudoalteromonas ruthenica TaxID=151081 RepID=UPI00110A6990|nr:PilZ domain-containing protein [Pseudoalteromonas ruthenica]TMO45141.1 PilZ domain-containing protein [Pseudoalteromonas ruthenica]TMO48666.1 PilZ domain-containing protein [Pseudoalteromonas ruthenica]
MENRRNFTRVIFQRPALVVFNNQHHGCHLLDLSLNGALVSHPDDFNPQLGQSVELIFHLSGSDVDIDMLAEVAHIEPQHIGLHCVKMDIDSATHLKRLIELNVGDDKLLHRELAQLAAPVQ